MDATAAPKEAAPEWLTAEVLAALGDVDVSALRQLVCPEVWSSVLTPDEREQLAVFLPLTPAGTADVQTIGRLARTGGDSFHFGHPFERFVARLRAGELSAEGVSKRAESTRTLVHAHREGLREYHDSMVDGLLALPSTWLLTAPRPQVHLMLPAAQVKPPPAKRSRPRGTGGAGTGVAPFAAGGACAGAAAGCGPIGASAQPGLGSGVGSGAGLDYGAGLAPGAVAGLQGAGLVPGGLAFALADAEEEQGGHAQGGEGAHSEEGTPARPPSRTLEPIATDLTIGPPLPTGPPPSCFLAVVRDAVCQAPNKIAPTEYLCRQVARRMEALGPEMMAQWVPADVTQRDFLLSALKFLVAPPPNGAPAGLECPVELPPGPLISFDAYTWVGYRQAAHAGGNEPAQQPQQQAEAAVVDFLDELHSSFYNQQLSVGQAYSTSRFGGSHGLAVARFREQEATRYAQPDRPYRFEFTARDSTGAERTFHTSV
ncbi:hypothetical protein T492DRAFT_913106, partial [Pavlovales sp. CCMP2436]